MYSQNMVFLPMSLLIKAWSLCQTSSIPQALLLTGGFTSLQATTLKMMDKPNAQTRPLSNTSMYIVTTSKTTGPNSCLLQSLSTIILQVLLPVFLYSSLIRDIIQTLLFTPNAILFPLKPITLLQISINYRVPSKLKSLQFNSLVRNPLMHNVPPLLISKQVTKSLLRLSSSKPLGLQRNSSKNILDPMKSLSSLVLYHSSSVSQSLCALFIQFSMYLCLNLLCLIFSPREYNWPLLQL